ncbi:MAG: four helix bundle protein [Gemmatimonadota bacterium]
MHDFRRLRVWQLSRELAAELGKVVQTFPRSDRGVIANQLRRSALSVPANISEGCGDDSRAETLRFLRMAVRSATETENHLVAAADAGFLRREVSDRFIERTVSIQKMLRALIQNLPK